MKLLVQTLETELKQSYRFKLHERQQIGAFIPYLYMHNSPSGTFYFKIFKNSVEIFSQSFDSSDLKSALNTTSDYLHAFYPIIPNNPTQLEFGDYEFVLSSSGYTSSSYSFIGWIQQFEDLNNLLDYAPSDDAENPLAMRVKILKEGIYA